MNGNYCTLTFTETFRKWSLDIQAGKYFAWKTLLSAIFLCLPLFSGCNAEDTAKVPPGSKKILIAVFSYTGNTRRVAEAIQRKTGGTLIEIEPETPYSKDYQAVVKQGKEEVDSGFRLADLVVHDCAAGGILSARSRSVGKNRRAVLHSRRLWHWAQPEGHPQIRAGSSTGRRIRAGPGFAEGNGCQDYEMAQRDRSQPDDGK